MKFSVLVFFLVFVAALFVVRVEADDLSPTEIARQAAPAVVSIKALAPSRDVIGSGFIVDPSGTIITNLHVIQGAKSVAVKLATGDIYDEVKIRSFDARKDLAVLQVPGYGLPILELGDSDTVQTGNPVVLIGNPLGVLEGSLSTGVVSGVRTLEGAGFRIIQTDAAANVGNSGGPLINSSGKVIGVITFKIKGTESLNFVLPINYARGLLASSESFGLDELATRLSNSPGDAFASNKPQFPARWKSLATGTTKVIRIDGDNVYVETILPAQQVQAGAFSLAELQKMGEMYIGQVRGAFVCSWTGWTAASGITQKFNRCEYNDPIEIRLLTATRIEGVIETHPPNTKIDCGKCKWKGKAEKSQFTWIPE